MIQVTHNSNFSSAINLYKEQVRMQSVQINSQTDLDPGSQVQSDPLVKILEEVAVPSTGWFKGESDWGYKLKWNPSAQDLENWEQEVFRFYSGKARKHTGNLFHVREFLGYSLDKTWREFFNH